MVRSYLDWLVEIPWSKATEDNLDIGEALRILDEDHFSLEPVKERILEYLAVRKLNPGTRGPILSFVGPPGVGKTSLGRSIARAMGRRFVRLSLGGVRDEAEIRGHRRTYIGAMPGRIAQALHQAGTCNPVVLLDEIDKIGADHRGDPSAALLEVLDPEQNRAFRDHYLGLPLDLSRVMFLATANLIEPIQHKEQPLLLDQLTSNAARDLIFRIQFLDKPILQRSVSVGPSGEVENHGDGFQWTPIRTIEKLPQKL